MGSKTNNRDWFKGVITGVAIAVIAACLYSLGQNIYSSYKTRNIFEFEPITYNFSFSSDENKSEFLAPTKFVERYDFYIQDISDKPTIIIPGFVDAGNQCPSNWKKSYSTKLTSGEASDEGKLLIKPGEVETLSYFITYDIPKTTKDQLKYELRYLPVKHKIELNIRFVAPVHDAMTAYFDIDYSESVESCFDSYYQDTFYPPPTPTPELIIH